MLLKTKEQLHPLNTTKVQLNRVSSEKHPIALPPLNTTKVQLNQRLG